jgi:hypothetical protein
MNHTKSRNAKNVIRGAIMFVILLMNHACFAQKEAPSWLNVGYVPLENSYIKVFCGGLAYTETQAKEMSTIEIVKDREMYTGGAYQWKDGYIVEKESGRIVVRAHILDEYTEKLSDGYKVYLLVQTATHPDNTSFDKDKVYVGDKYPFSARVFVPGMAQIYKGSVGKGAAFITGEVLFVGGIVTTEFMRRDYSNKIGQTHDPRYIEYYAQNANICAITRNVCIGGAVALYIWNIIDGAVAKGRPYVSIDGKKLTFNPYVSSNSTGIALTFKF